VACRYGGEEFCLLMPRTQAQAARRKCQALLKQWVQHCSAAQQPMPGAHTFSAGVADSQGVIGGVSDLLKAADDALLLAKRLGRNRVRLQADGSRAAA
jgi:diguanylate cyclase (GGDEF)-like protein